MKPCQKVMAKKDGATIVKQMVKYEGISLAVRSNPQSRIPRFRLPAAPSVSFFTRRHGSTPTVCSEPGALL